MNMTDTLRQKSDALLEACGWHVTNMQHEDGDIIWSDPEGRSGRASHRPHPYANAQNAIDLAAAMGLKILQTLFYEDMQTCIVLDQGKTMYRGEGPTIAEAISEAILGAVKGMERLGSDFEKVYDDNVDKLYEE